MQQSAQWCWSWADIRGYVRELDEEWSICDKCSTWFVAEPQREGSLKVYLLWTPTCRIPTLLNMKRLLGAWKNFKMCNLMT